MNVLKIKVNGKEGLIPYFEEENGFILDKKLKEEININIQNNDKKDISGIKNLFKTDTIDEDSYFIYPKLQEICKKGIIVNQEVIILSNTVRQGRLHKTQIKDFALNLYCLLKNTSKENKNNALYINKEYSDIINKDDISIFELINRLNYYIEDFYIIYKNKKLMDKISKFKHKFISRSKFLSFENKELHERILLDEKAFLDLRKNFLIYDDILEYKNTEILKDFILKKFKDIEKPNKYCFYMFYDLYSKHNDVSNPLSYYDTFSEYIEYTNSLISLFNYKETNSVKEEKRKIFNYYGIEEEEFKEIFKIISLEDYNNFLQYKQDNKILEDFYLDCSVY